MSYIDVTGKTEEEAIQKALAQLGMDRDDVSVEILERAKSGFLGIGSNPAKVRITYGPEDASMEEPVVVSPVKPEPVVEKKSVAEKKPEVKKIPEVKKENTDVKENPVEKQISRMASPVDGLEECDDENAKQITAFLSGLLEQLESSANIKVYEVEKGHYKVILEGEKIGHLIGRRGETLDAIQQLANYAVNSGRDKRVRIHVDAENYRAKREQSLESLAKKVAAKVAKYRRSVTLEPMNAYERHVIHAVLQDTPHITTFSIGTEPNRRVVVSYEK